MKYSVSSLLFPFIRLYNYPTEVFDGSVLGTIANNITLSFYDPIQLSGYLWAPNWLWHDIYY